jgi:fumarate hydratase class I
MAEMVTIREADLIDSGRCAQYISYFHPMDYIRARRGLQGRAGPAAKDAIAQILTNSRMCAEATARCARTRASSTCSSSGARIAD